MRRQIFVISLAAATFALLIGFFFAKKLTQPVQELAAGAHRIAGGDFSQRIEVQQPHGAGRAGRVIQPDDRPGRALHRATCSDAADENRQLFLGTVKALAAAIDGKDPYTRGHSERVARFSVAIAQGLDLPDDEIEKIRISALLHDVGKIGIDDNILKKPAALTDEEFEIMKQHPQKGYKIMSQIPAMREFLPGMYMHHEMIDGNGYPQGLKGDEIPMQARIVSVADTFDAMTTDRPYQRAMKFDDALSQDQGLRRHALRRARGRLPRRRLRVGASPPRPGPPEAPAEREDLDSTRHTATRRAPRRRPGCLTRRRIPP